MLIRSCGVSSMALTVCSEDVYIRFWRDTIGSSMSPLKYSILDSEQSEDSLYMQ